MNAERQLIESMRSFFEKGDTRPEAYRREQLKKLRSLLEEHRAEIEAALKADLRKPAFEAETSEIGVTISEIDHALSSLSRWMKPRRVPTPALLQPASSLVRSEPLGVVLVIAPWNYPVNLLLSPLVGALAAGNCVVLKPSELAPTVSAVMTKLLNTAYPAELVRVVEGGKDETTRLLELPFDHIFYTGSTPVGRVVMEAAAKNLVPVTLELGGKSPCIVCEDADLAVSARRIAWGKFTNAGQTCVAPDYVLAHATVKDALITELGRAVEELWGTDPQKSPDYGRVINERHFRRLEALLTSGRAAVGGRVDGADRYIAPTVLDGVDWDSKAMEDEIFGPILPVIAYGNLDEALRKIRARPRPLALYVFTPDEAKEKRVMESVSFGGGCVNDTVMHLGNPHLPFGGVGASGMGAYHGDKSFATFSHEKAILKRSLAYDLKFRYPPYDMGRLNLIRKLRSIFG